jgi:hypothetical protein
VSSESRGTSVASFRVSDINQFNRKHDRSGKKYHRKTHFSALGCSKLDQNQNLDNVRQKTSSNYHENLSDESSIDFSVDDDSRRKCSHFTRKHHRFGDEHNSKSGSSVLDCRKPRQKLENVRRRSSDNHDNLSDEISTDFSIDDNNNGGCSHFNRKRQHRGDKHNSKIRPSALNSSRPCQKLENVTRKRKSDNRDTLSGEISTDFSVDGNRGKCSGFNHFNRKFNRKRHRLGDKHNGKIRPSALGCSKPHQKRENIRRKCCSNDHGNLSDESSSCVDESFDSTLPPEVTVATVDYSENGKRLRNKKLTCLV